MLKIVPALLTLALCGCASVASYNEERFSSSAEREAYVMGSAHAGLAYCAASIDAQALGLHASASRMAAMALTGARPKELRAAYEAGLKEGGGFSSPHRVPCSEAAAVLNCSLEDYLGQWRAAQPASK